MKKVEMKLISFLNYISMLILIIDGQIGKNKKLICKLTRKA